MKNIGRSQARVFLQGKDFKAQKWAHHIEAPVEHFSTVWEMASIFMKSRMGDIHIYRYQNNPPGFFASLVILILLGLQILKAFIARQHIVWICHNVDRDTQPFHLWIQSLRRKMLFKYAKVVFVLDQAFVAHCDRSDAIPISFGRKSGGQINPKNLQAIKALTRRVDRVILIAGQDGGKYKAFARIPEIHSRFEELGLNPGFVTAGMAKDRSFPEYIERNLLRIVEPNIRESELSESIDFIYRENADISIPYSIYSAATASIPVLTRDDNILAKIVKREKIGITLENLENSDNVDYDFVGFFERHQWCSLRDQLTLVGILN